MKKNNLQSAIFGLFVLLFLWAGACRATDVEHLEYHVSYKGVLSLFKTLKIGRVLLSSQSSELKYHDRVNQYELYATSKGYPLVERLYPYRYRFRSYYDLENQQIRLFEKLQKTRKFKHKLATFDYVRQHGQIYHSKNDSMKFLTDHTGPTSYVQLLENGQLKKAAKPLLQLPEQLTDRLSLLHEIRRQDLAEGKTAMFMVSNGDELMSYRYRVEKMERIELGGRPIDAWKIRIDGLEGETSNYIDDHDEWSDYLQTVSEDNNKAPLRHAPVYLWVSGDKERLPLKFVSRHSVGTFTVLLKS